MKKKSKGLFIIGWVMMVLFSISAIGMAEDAPALLLKQDIRTIINGLDTSIPALMEKARVPGLQIALVRDGKIVWQKGFGVKNINGHDPVTTDTIFEAASFTKPFFAYVVMKLVEENVLDLDTPLIKYLPREGIEQNMGHSLDEPGFHKEWFEKITARHVLSHSSGLPHGEGGRPYPIFFAPGSKYKYSADGYVYLQKTIEYLKGEKLDVIMKKYVLDPLGMTHSCMVWREDYEKTAANGHGYFGKPEAFRKRTEANSAASLYTTAGDYTRFVCAVMAGEGLKKETLDLMLTPQIDVDKDKGLAWSLGFGLQTDSNGKAFWQWGDYGIFRNYIIAYPQQRLAVVYLTNSFYGLSICQEIVGGSIGGLAMGNRFLGYKPYNYPVYDFARKVYEQGAEVVEKQFAEVKAKYPDDFGPETVSLLADAFLNEKLYDTAIAFYRFNVREAPQSAQALCELARAYLQKGDKADRAEALSCYKKAKEVYKVYKDEKFDIKTIDWDLAYMQALDNPKQLPADYLNSLTGDYGPRHIKFENGRLYYFRDNGTLPDYAPMIAMEKDTFVIEGLVNFRFKFEFDDQGHPVRIVGIFDAGQLDPTPRNK